MQKSRLNNAGRHRRPAPAPAPAGDEGGSFFGASWRNTMEFVGDWMSEVFLEEHRVDSESSESESEVEMEERRGLMNTRRRSGTEESHTIVDLQASEATPRSDGELGAQVRMAREQLDRRGAALEKTANTMSRLEQRSAQIRAEAAAVRAQREEEAESRQGKRSSCFGCC